MATVVETTALLPVAQATQGASVESMSNIVVTPIWWEYLKMDYWVKMFGDGGKFFFIGCWALLGMVTGYLVKRYARAMITIAIGSLCVGAICELLGLITFNWDVLRQLCGGSLNQTFSGSVMHLLELIKQNAILYGAGLAGFIVGHILGQPGDE